MCDYYSMAVKFLRRIKCDLQQLPLLKRVLFRCFFASLLVLGLQDAAAGPCDFPDQRAKDGSRCGNRAASVRPGGREPIRAGEYSTDWVLYTFAGFVAFLFIASRAGSSRSKPEVRPKPHVDPKQRYKAANLDSNRHVEGLLNLSKQTGETHQKSNASCSSIPGHETQKANSVREKQHDDVAQIRALEKSSLQQDQPISEKSHLPECSQSACVILCLSESFDHPFDPSMLSLLQNSIEFGEENAGTEFDMAVDYLMSIITHESQRGLEADFEYVHRTAERILANVDQLTFNQELIESQALKLRSSGSGHTQL